MDTSGHNQWRAGKGWEEKQQSILWSEHSLPHGSESFKLPPGTLLPAQKHTNCTRSFIKLQLLIQFLMVRHLIWMLAFKTLFFFRHAFFSLCLIILKVIFQISLVLVILAAAFHHWDVHHWPEAAQKQGGCKKTPVTRKNQPFCQLPEAKDRRMMLSFPASVNLFWFCWWMGVWAADPPTLGFSYSSCLGKVITASQKT